MNKAAVVQQTKAANVAHAASRVLQLQCTCGNHTVAGGECTGGCSKKNQALQRSSRSPEAAGASEVASIVHEVLRSPGQS